MSTREERMRIRDVARVARVSTTTVSQVLNGQAGAIRISADTVERVRQVAEQLRYRPNAAARSLRTSKTRTIGVIARDLLSPWMAELLGTIYDVCDARNFHLLIGHAGHSRREGWELSSILHADRVDGVLLIGDLLREADEQRVQDQMRALVQMHRHVVSVASRPSIEGELAFTIDYVQGTTLALDHLTALGHRVIGFCGLHTGPHAASWEAQLRLTTYRDYLDAHGLPRNAANEAQMSYDSNDAQHALQSMLTHPQRPTAVFVDHDRLAITVLRAAHLCGIRVPEELSVVGFDDISFAAESIPSLTTVHYPLDELGHRAAAALLDAVEGKAAADQAASMGMLLVPTIVCRESSGPSPGQ